VRQIDGDCGLADASFLAGDYERDQGYHCGKKPVLGNRKVMMNRGCLRRLANGPIEQPATFK